MTKVAIILATSLILSCCNKKESIQKPEGSQTTERTKASRSELRELRAAGLLNATQGLWFWKSQEIDARDKLRETTGAGEAALLVEDLRAISAAETEADEWHSSALKEWYDVDLGDQFAGPELPVEEGELDYMQAISAYTQALEKAMKENARDASDGDWKSRMDEWHRLQELDLDNVMSEFSK
jgi:hypothetical protein